MHFDGFDSDGALNRPGGLQLKGVHPGSDTADGCGQRAQATTVCRVPHPGDLLSKICF